MTRDGTTSALRARSGTEALRGTRGAGTAAELWARLARAPAAWLGLLVAASTVVRGAVGARVPTPWILPDELVYSELAKSIASGTDRRCGVCRSSGGERCTRR